MSELRPQPRQPHPIGGALACTLILVARSAAADAPAPEAPATVAAPPPLTRIRDDRQLAEAVQTITQDPAIAVDDPATRLLAQALITEGVRQLQGRAQDQALANFLEAYARFPSPRILLPIAATLRDMGRLADAANTYQRYLADPASAGERADEIKELLLQLDEQLTLLTVRVFARGSEISLDGGPFVAVGSSLTTRVRSGIHLVRIRKGAQSSELTINGFEGETKQVAPTLPAAAGEASAAGPREALPDRVDGWLITGTQYTADSATGRARKVRGSSDGRELAAIIPRYDLAERSEPVVRPPDDNAISTGVLGALRIDGKGRGFAGGLGLAISRGRLEAELMVLKSSQLGGYLGLRYRWLNGVFRPYAAVGVPGFAFDHDELQSDGSTMTTQRLAVGLRIAAGIELVINSHLGVQGDLGYEHFFFLDDHYEADVLVPTVGVIGRL